MRLAKDGGGHAWSCRRCHRLGLTGISMRPDETNAKKHQHTVTGIYTESIADCLN